MEIHLDTVIRLMSVGASALLLMMILVGNVRRSLKIVVTGLLIGGAAYQINSSTFLKLDRAIELALDLISLSTPFWTWLFARILFERLTPNWFIGFLALVYIVGWYLANFIDPPKGVGFYLIHITSLLLVADLIYLSVSGLADDLVHRRRMVRIYLPILVGLQAGGILIYELWFGTTTNNLTVQIVNGSLIFALVLFGGLAFLKTDTSILIKNAENSSAPEKTSDLSASETVLNDKLMIAMENGQYRETGLTIQKLAKHLATPEHRLRALINQKLGHRNFSSFLNGHRISEAKEKLADRELVDLPILTIAMDLGYNSLAPFNRAFRAETGKTPSDFRRSAIDQN